MEGGLGNGQTGDGLVREMDLKSRLVPQVFADLVFADLVFAGLIVAGLVFAGVAASTPASAQVYGERPERYGNTASFFFYDNRDDQRDFPTNGVFPGNFASDRFFAGVGAAGWLGGSPQHQAAPYPSQPYFVAEGDRLICPPGYRVEAAAPGPSVKHLRRRILCVSP